MKTFKKSLCVFLSALLCFALLVPVFADEIIEEEKERQPLVIFVEGIAACPILEVGTDESIFPPSTSAIVGAVTKMLPAITEAIAKQDTAVLEQPAVEAANALFLPASCDENGVPSPNTYFDWEWPSDEKIIEAYESDDPHSRVVYCYDWRLSMQTIVAGLHDYIMHVMEVTGAEKVSLIGFSMGTCAVMSYLKMYEDEYFEYVDDVVLLAGAFTGVSSCGEPFSGNVYLDSDALVRFVDGMLSTEDSVLNIFLNSLLHALNESGLMDKVIDLGNLIIERLKPAVYEQVFAQTFATMPGMWSLIAPEDYEPAKTIVGEKLTPEYIEIIDWYQYEVRANAEDIINDCIARDIHFGIVTKYGYAVTPVISDINSMSDSVIDTKYESFGATCAPVDSTLGEDYAQAIDNGHDCISPDNMIDSSTCKYCDYTWFVKNVAHSNEYGAMMDVCRSIIDADEQITVWDAENNAELYPQYCVFDRELGIVVPLTADNDYGKYMKNPSEETAFSIFVDFVKNYVAYIKNTIAGFKAQLRSLGGKIAGVFTSGKIC